MMSKKPTCTWRNDPKRDLSLGDLFVIECRPNNFRSTFPVNEMSYCPYCGKWISAPVNVDESILAGPFHDPRPLPVSDEQRILQSEKAETSLRNPDQFKRDCSRKSGNAQLAPDVV